MERTRLTAQLGKKNSRFYDDLEKWETWANNKTKNDTDRTYAQNIAFEHTMNSLRLLQKEIAESNWMFESFES